MTTTTIPTNQLTGPALNWAVAIAEGIPPERLTFWANTGAVVLARERQGGQRLDYDTNANQMHEIIEREGINIECRPDPEHGRWWVALLPGARGDGPTALIAAARAFVAHKLGPTVHVPCELVEG